VTEGEAVWWRQPGKGFSHLGDSAPANIDLAKEQVGEHAQQGDGTDHHDPSDPGGRRTIGSQQDPREDGKPK
jgi:hypothetical protein